ncbi:hypothetical protein [Gulbenkiania mobilis]|uniref:Chorismate lyase n=1 Tax=Gulbenkiania mobilis TaxID=397457 RepID=A0ABY2CVV9_GULMO|nr:hypothetical protein [Gulbenkiania mobilis]TCW30700.1 hypothetical protein EV669_10617 [Gulbenkiania mobilis]
MKTRFERLRERWRTVSANLPVPHRDGVSLPAAFLLPRLKRAIDSDDCTLEHLTLAPGKACMLLRVKRPLSAEVHLTLTPTGVDWADRCLRVGASVSATSTAGSTLGRGMARLVLSQADTRMGWKLIAAQLEHLPFLSLTHRQLILHLDRIPALQRWLTQPVFGQPLGERLRLSAFDCEEDALRLRFARSAPE